MLGHTPDKNNRQHTFGHFSMAKVVRLGALIACTLASLTLFDPLNTCTE